MDVLTLLISFTIMGVVIKIAVDYMNSIVLPFTDIQKYSVLEAFILAVATIFAYNRGLLTTLEIPIDISLQPYFHYVDLCLTSLILAGGANGIHKVVEGIKEYSSKKK